MHTDFNLFTIFSGLLQVKDSKQAKDVLSTFYSEGILQVGELPRQLWTDYKLLNKTSVQMSSTSGHVVKDSLGREVSKMKFTDKGFECW